MLIVSFLFLSSNYKQTKLYSEDSDPLSRMCDTKVNNINLINLWLLIVNATPAKPVQLVAQFLSRLVKKKTYLFADRDRLCGHRLTVNNPACMTITAVSDKVSDSIGNVEWT